MIRILHVEDNQNDIELLRMQFMRESDAFSLTGVTSVEAALGKLEHDDFDCIICDIQLPGKSGLEMLRAVRSAGYTLPFVFLTGQGNEETAAEALRMGASDYYSKDASDYRGTRLRNSIKRHVTSYRLQKQHSDEVNKVRAVTEQYQQLFDTVDNPLLVFSANHSLRNYNPAFKQLLKQADLPTPRLSTGVAELPLDFSDSFISSLDQAVTTANSVEGTCHTTGKNGISCNYICYPDTSTGAVEAVVVILKDIQLGSASEGNDEELLAERLQQERKALQTISAKFRGQLSDRIKFEKIFMVLHDLAQSLATIKDSSAFYQRVCTNLGTLINTENIYIAIHKQGTLYTFPYIKDRYDDEQEEESDLKGSLTDYVFRTGEPLLINEKKHQELINAGIVDEVIGGHSKIWMGVPLKSDNHVFGVLAVQSYDDEFAFGPDDLDLLTIVSNQFALAIQKRIAEDQLMRYQMRLEERVRERTKDLQNINLQLQQEVELRSRSERMLSSLYSLSRTAVTSKSLNDLLNTIFKELKELLGEIALYIAYQPDDSAPLSYIFNPEDDDREHTAVARKVMDYVFNSGSTLFYAGTAAEGLNDEIGSTIAEQEHSWMAVPLVTSGGVGGGIVLRKIDSQDTFTSSEFTLFNNVSINLAQTIEKRISDDDRGLLLDYLKDKNDQLSNLNDELEAFAYSVSHDLRKPIRHVFGFAGLLQDIAKDRKDEEINRLVDRITSACQNMNGLIEDLLTLSRINRVEIKRSPIDISEICTSILDEIQESQPENTVRVAIENGLKAEAEPSLTRVMLQNLLENAWKFSRKSDQPSIEVQRIDRNGKSYIAIQDNGTGFEQHKEKEIFAPFVRLHREDEYEGTGIGLATVARIVHRHGGSIHAESSPGQGATFYFRLQ